MNDQVMVSPRASVIRDVPAPSTPIFNATAALEAAQDRLDVVVQKLEGRLQPVLGPSTPYDVPQPPQPAPVSDLAALLGGFGDSFHDVAERLDRLIARLEL